MLTVNDLIFALVVGLSTTLVAIALLQPLVRERKVEIVQVYPKHAKKPDK